MDRDEDPREGGATEMGRQMMPQAGVHTSESPELLLFVITTLLYLSILFFCGEGSGVCATAHACGGQRAIQGHQFFSPTTWDPRIELGSPGLTSGTLSN